MTVFTRLVLVSAIAVGVSACKTASGGSSAGTRILQPGAPGQDTKSINTTQATDLSKVGHTPADVKFMQGMIGHHAQALEMTALLHERTRRDDMRLLAKRIEVSQADEIQMMQQWLEARGQQVPGPHAHHAPGAPLMPGMLTAAEMARLSDARGDAFDRLFLELMIKHHEGALVMVAELLGSQGAAQDSELFALVSDIEADQRAEIARMQSMLRALGARSTP
jgi:uncharacterized protein (DUF305 family)